MSVREEILVRRAPRIALRPAEAAAALGVSLDLFKKEIAPQLRHVRLGNPGENAKKVRMVKLYPVREIERWVEAEATRLPE